MSFDLMSLLRDLDEVGKAALKSYEKEANIHIKWANGVAKAVKKGTVDVRLLVKTPGNIKAETVLQSVPENDASPTNMEVQSCNTLVPQQKRLSEEHIESTSKRIRASKKTSNDSGISNGSQNMRDNTLTVNAEKESHSFDNGQLGTVKDEPISPQINVSSNLLNSSGTQKKQEAGQTQGLPLLETQTNVSNVQSKEQPEGTTPSLLPRTPVRVNRAKSRSLVKVASEPENSSSKDEDSASEIVRTQQVYSTNTTEDDDSISKLINQGTPLSSSFIRPKPFASASRIPQLLSTAASPFVNRLGPLTPSFQRSNSFTASNLPNLVTGAKSFILKPAAHQPINKEDGVQNIKSKAEAAIKKKEEIGKALMEEKRRIREEKRLKVIAQREAKEREKLENIMKQEQIREARQKQIQAEREEQIRQANLRKKLLAEKKAAEIEERKRQEEEAKLAKLKQQEEEAERTAALYIQEKEEAERKLKERKQREIEAAACRAKETDVHAKQTSSKSQADLTFTSVPLKNHQTKTKSDDYNIADAGADDSSDDEGKPKKPVPLWAQSKHCQLKLREDYHISQSQIFMFFGSRKTTPDLSKIFTAIDRRMLLRKSSAVWRTPPKDKF